MENFQPKQDRSFENRLAIIQTMAPKRNEVKTNTIRSTPWQTRNDRKWHKTNNITKQDYNTGYITDSNQNQPINNLYLQPQALRAHSRTFNRFWSKQIRKNQQIYLQQLTEYQSDKRDYVETEETTG